MYDALGGRVSPLLHACFSGCSVAPAAYIVITEMITSHGEGLPSTTLNSREIELKILMVIAVASLMSFLLMGLTDERKKGKTTRLDYRTTGPLELRLVVLAGHCRARLRAHNGPAAHWSVRNGGSLLIRERRSVAIDGVMGGHDPNQIDQIINPHLRHQSTAMRLNCFVADAE